MYNVARWREYSQPYTMNYELQKISMIMQWTQLHKNLNANDKNEVLPRDEDPPHVI